MRPTQVSVELIPHRDSVHCPPYTVARAPSKNVTPAFCSKFDLSKWLIVSNDDSTGDFGIFDSSLWRLQMVLSDVRRDPLKNQLYSVAGAALLNKKVHFFTGIIFFDSVKQYDCNYWFAKDTCQFADNPDFAKAWRHRYDEKNVDLFATYLFTEDSTQTSAGTFSGKLTFCLTIDSANQLEDKMMYWEGLNSPANFVYNGIFTAHSGKKETWTKWSPMAIDELRGSCHGTGQSMETWLPNCNYPELVKRGWKTNNSEQLVYNPLLWWRRKSK